MVFTFVALTFGKIDHVHTAASKWTRDISWLETLGRLEPLVRQVHCPGRLWVKWGSVRLTAFWNINQKIKKYIYIDYMNLLK